MTKKREEKEGRKINKENEEKVNQREEDETNFKPIEDIPEIGFKYDNSKAGLEKVDPEKINEIIMELSKGSQYSISEQKRLQEVKDKVSRYKQKIEKYKSNEKLWEKAEKEVRRRIEEHKGERGMKRSWIHVDMDMFYAAVEIRDNPSLADKPVAVGDRSMIATTNYIARKYGVRSAIPCFIGKRLCPELIIVKPNFAKYKQVSEEFKSICREYDPDLESQGLDEVNLDITSYLRKNGLDHELGRIFVADKIRKTIKEKLNLTCSCGIACNNMLAKICSDIKKPNGLTYLEFSEKEISKFMLSLQIRKVPGVGKINEQILTGLGIITCKQVLEKATEIFINFTENSVEFLLRSALGISRNVHEESQGQKSISVTETFKPITEYQEFKDKLLEKANELGDKVKASNLAARTITLELKNCEYKVMRKSLTAQKWISKHKDFIDLGLTLLDQFWPMEPIRSLSLRLNNIRQLISYNKSNKLEDCKKNTDYRKVK